MNSPRQCGNCGRPLPGHTPEGLCPNCLLEVGAFELRISSDRSPADSKFEGSASGSGNSGAKIFGNYELLEKIGQGGMGEVYRARQLNLGRLVAVKLLPFGQFSRDDLVQRFRTEAAAAAALRHPNIVGIHDVGEHEGQPYFSMDLIIGHTLAEAVRDQPLAPRRAAVYLKTIAEAVQYAHEHGVLHRDLKPSNVLIDESDQPHITDFGLAKRLSSPDCGMESLELTFTGQVLGSPNFISPEQAEGRPHTIGPAADIYSLGALLYHLLTRQPPFQADTLTTLLKQVIETDPVAPRLLNPSIPRDLETICLKCLEKEPSCRYRTALALAEDLGRSLAGKPILARPVAPVTKALKWCRRRPALAGMTVAALVILMLGLSGVLWQWRRATAGELLARQNAYAADMMLAQRALDDGNRGLALRLLEPYRLRALSEIELRHWEWRYLWQLCQPDNSVRLQTKSTPSGPAFISQNGRIMAVRTGPANIEVWDLLNKRQTGELPGFDSSRILGLSADGALLALRRSNQPVLEVWDLTQRKLAAALDHPSVPTRSLAFSPDGQLLATFDHHSSNAVVRVIDWAAGRTLTNFTTLAPRRGDAGVVAFSPDGQRLAIGGDYGFLRVVRWPNGSVVQIETQTHEGATALAFSPDSRLLAAGFEYSSATIRFWTADSGEPRGQLTSPNGWVLALTFSPEGEWLASASSDQSLHIWSVVDKVERRRFRGFQQDVRNLSFLPSGGTLASGGEDGSVGLWKVDTSSRPSNPARIAISLDSSLISALAEPDTTPAPSRFGIAFTPDSKQFITTDTNGLLAVWDTGTMRLTESLPALGADNWGVALSRDGHWLAAGNRAERIQIWDWWARRHVASLKMPSEWCDFLRFSTNGSYLLAWVWFNNHTVKAGMWRTRDWEEVPLTPLQDPKIMSVDVSPDERRLATGSADGWIKVWSLPDGHLEAAFRPHTGWVFCLRFSPDGRLLVSTGDAKVRLWDVTARRELESLPGHLGTSWGIAFSPDGRRLATGGLENQDAVKLWDVATRRELLSLPGDGPFFTDLTFSPDGDTFVATSLATGIAHFWRAPTWEEIAAAQKDR
jgi:eukaryotic-like serine/threonine-protein kinase